MKSILKIIILFYFSNIYSENLWDLNRCIDYALEHNVENKKLELNIDESEIMINDAKNKFLPNISILSTNSISSGFQQQMTGENPGVYEEISSYQNNISLSASIPIWTTDAQMLNIKAKKILKDVELSEIEDYRLKLKSDIILKYYNILLAKNKVEIAKNALEFQRKITEKSRQLHEIGDLSLKDYNDAKCNIIVEEKNLIVEISNLNRAKLQLKQLLLIEDSTWDIADEKVIPIIEYSLISIKNIALKNNYKLLGYKKLDEYYTIERKIFLRNFFPSIYFNYDVGTSAQSILGSNNIPIVHQWENNFYQRVSISIQIPIIGNSSMYTSIKQSKLNKQRLLYDIESTENNIRNEIESIYMEYLDYISLYYKMIEQCDSLLKQLNFTIDEFEIGKISSFELNTYKNKYLGAKLECVKCQYEALYNYKLLNLYIE